MENPTKIRMMTGDSPISGKLHVNLFEVSRSVTETSPCGIHHVAWLWQHQPGHLVDFTLQLTNPEARFAAGHEEDVMWVPNYATHHPPTNRHFYIGGTNKPFPLRRVVYMAAFYPHDWSLNLQFVTNKSYHSGGARRKR